MRVRYLAISAATLMTIAATELSTRADDTAPAAPDASTATPAATTETPPVSVPRPSIVPKTSDRTAEPKAVETPQASDNSTPRRRRHYVHRRHHWRYAYWEPFPIYWPHLYHNRLYWNRIPWFSF